MYLTKKDIEFTFYSSIFIVSGSSSNKSNLYFWCLWANPWKIVHTFQKQIFSLYESRDTWKAELLFSLKTYKGY